MSARTTGAQWGSVSCAAWVLLSTVALPGRPGAEDDNGRVDLSGIIDNVATNESLYENIEVRSRSTYRLESPFSSSPPLVRSSQSGTRFVSQSGMAYLDHRYEGVTTDGKPDKTHSLRGNDGRRTRLLAHDSVGNIQEGPFDGRLLFRAHTMLLDHSSGLGVDFPLSTFLKGGKEVRAFPRFQRTTLSVHYEKDEMIDGLNCHLVRFDEYEDGRDKDGHGPGMLHLWIAPERNYLPVLVRTHCRPVDLDSEANINREVHAENWREISPGVWLPFRATYTNFQPKPGGRSVWNTTEVVLDKAELDPHYDVSFFQDVPFPEGVKVYELDLKGKITRSYTQGGAHVQPPPASGWKSWTIAGALGGCAVLTAGLLGWRHRRARMATG